MDHADSRPPARPESRRQFIRKTGAAAAAMSGAALFGLPAIAASGSPIVAIATDPADPITDSPPVLWAMEQLHAALASRGLQAELSANLAAVPKSADSIFIGGPQSAPLQTVFAASGIAAPAAAESLAMARGRIAGKRSVLAVGGDVRGLVYALLDLADRVRLADDPLAALKAVKPVSERPANAIRSVARAFVSDVEDKSWFQDREFWSRYLTMLAAQRFNRFNLTLGIGYDFTMNITDCYFHFAYPFLLEVPGYNVRAEPLPDAERDLNLAMLRFISDEAAARGLHFQLGLWTHAWQWTRSPQANYTITGLTPETHGPYCREALQALLAACPAISGITFRIHGESGVPEGNYDLWKTIFDGVAHCGRRVEIDMHAKGMDQGMIDVALGTGMPVNISPKFWAEHMGLPYMQGAIRPQEMPPRDARDTGFFSRSSGSRSFLRYGYGDLLAEGRRYGVLHRIWPGTQRVLLWGDPAMAAAYGRVSSFCGSLGVEWFEPLFFKGRKGSGLPGGRDGYADPSLRTGADFEKYDYAYRLWGRSLYHPATGAASASRLLHWQFGRAAEAAQTALASASGILPLVVTAHCPSAANNNYWPEMYFDMAIASSSRTNPYSDTPTPKRFGTVSPLDPEFFLSADDCAAEFLRGERSGKYSPIRVARQLEQMAAKADGALRDAERKVRDRRDPAFRRLAADVTIQAGLGTFYAAKFRAAVLYAIYLRHPHLGTLDQAIAANRRARAAWAGFAEFAKTVYRDDLTYGPEYFQRGNWLDRLPAMDADLADLEALRSKTDLKSGAWPPMEARAAMMALGADPEPPAFGGRHAPPSGFQPGQPLVISLSVPKSRELAGIVGIRLRYRRVNQAELWQALDLERRDAAFVGTIPAGYTDSPFPLQYHFQIRFDAGAARLYPGLEPGWEGQPYFVVRQGAGAARSA